MQIKFVLLLFSVLFVFGCGSTSTAKQTINCECPFTEIYAYTKGKVKSYSGNANIDDFERDDVVKIEGNAELTMDDILKKIPSGKAGFKVVYTKNENEDKTLKILEVEPGTDDKISKYFIFYCIKYHNNVEKDCFVPENKRKQFDIETTEYFYKLMGTSSDEYTPIKEHPRDGYIKRDPSTESSQNEEINLKSVGTDCNGSNVLINRDYQKIIKAIRFVNANEMSFQNAKINLQLICNELDHSEKQSKMIDALYYVYVLKYGLQNKSEGEIRGMFR